MKENIRYIYRNFREIIKNLFIFNKYKVNRNAYDLIRLTHSIEKGLSINNLRLGFGHDKQNEMLKLINRINNKKEKTSIENESIDMAISSLFEYVKIHEENNYCDEFILELKKFLLNFKNNFAGGTLEVNKKKYNEKEIESFFKSRHSVRDFSGKEVNINQLKMAIQLAQCAPSACNRQAVNVYILDKKYYSDIENWLEGIGGFAKDVDKFLIITGKRTAYRLNENYQYIVSPSIYVGYLTLTLQLYGIGSCVIQRPVIWNKEWSNLQKKHNIPKDEQIICMIACGILKDKYKVPMSHRIDDISVIL